MMCIFTWNQFPIKNWSRFFACFTCGAQILEYRYVEVKIITKGWKPYFQI